MFVHRYSQRGLRRTTLEDTLTGNLHIIVCLLLCLSVGISSQCVLFCLFVSHHIVYVYTLIAKKADWFILRESMDLYSVNGKGRDTLGGSGHSTLRGRERSVFYETNIGTVSRATLRKRQGGAHMGFRAPRYHLELKLEGG